MSHMRWDFILFFASLVMIYFGDWALYIGVGGLVLSLLHGTLKQIPQQRIRRMIIAVGITVSAVTFLGLSAFALKPGWFGLAATKSPSDDQKTARMSEAVAHLSELGWTVKTLPNEVQFSVAGGEIPPMEKSASYFKQISKGIALQLSQVK